MDHVGLLYMTVHKAVDTLGGDTQLRVLRMFEIILGSEFRRYTTHTEHAPGFLHVSCFSGSLAPSLDTASHRPRSSSDDHQSRRVFESEAAPTIMGQATGSTPNMMSSSLHKTYQMKHMAT